MRLNFSPSKFRLIADTKNILVISLCMHWCFLKMYESICRSQVEWTKKKMIFLKALFLSQKRYFIILLLSWFFYEQIIQLNYVTQKLGRQIMLISRASCQPRQKKVTSLNFITQDNSIRNVDRSSRAKSIQNLLWPMCFRACAHHILFSSPSLQTHSLNKFYIPYWVDVIVFVIANKNLSALSI